VPRPADVTDEAPYQMPHNDPEAPPFEAFFSECPLMAAITDAGGRLLRANGLLMEALGLTSDSLSSASLASLSHDEDRGVVEASILTLDAPGKRVSWVARTRARKGVAARWLRWWCVRRSSGEGGAGGGLFATAADITQWKQEDDARRNNEARLSAIVREAPVAVIEFGVGGRILSWNPGAERVFGYSAAEAIGKTSEEIIDVPGAGAGKGADAERNGRALLERGGVSKTTPNVTKDGKHILCEWQLLLVRDEGGAVFSVAALVRDVTVQCRLESELGRSRDVLRLLLDNVPLIVWTVDMNGVFTYSEGSGLTALRAKPGELVGQSFFDRFREYPLVVDSVWRALQGDNSLHTTEFGGSVWENRYLPVHDADGAMIGVAGMSLDVTERVRTEQELRTRLDVIERQKDAIRALAMPIIQVWDGVLALPVIGEVEPERAAGIIETLLRAIVQARARHAIIDLTGVELIDTSSVERLIKVVEGVELLGAKAILTGIRPEVANIMVSLGLDLSRVKTLRNLREAIKLCMRDRRP
jgi:rsbT co-antagonist protein RsbR